jgi:hypothetical protein
MIARSWISNLNQFSCALHLVTSAKAARALHHIPCRCHVANRCLSTGFRPQIVDGAVMPQWKQYSSLGKANYIGFPPSNYMISKQELSTPRNRLRKPLSGENSQFVLCLYMVAYLVPCSNQLTEAEQLRRRPELPPLFTQEGEIDRVCSIRKLSITIASVEANCSNHRTFAGAGSRLLSHRQAFNRDNIADLS